MFYLFSGLFSCINKTEFLSCLVSTLVRPSACVRPASAPLAGLGCVVRHAWGYGPPAFPLDAPSLLLPSSFCMGRRLRWALEKGRRGCSCIAPACLAFHVAILPPLPCLRVSFAGILHACYRAHLAIRIASLVSPVLCVLC